jgi:hypothetical protein
VADRGDLVCLLHFAVELPKLFEKAVAHWPVAVGQNVRELQKSGYVAA